MNFTRLSEQVRRTARWMPEILFKADAGAWRTFTVLARQHWMNIDSILKKMLHWRDVFQPVMVDEPSVEDAISILRGLKSVMKYFMV